MEVIDWLTLRGIARLGCVLLLAISVNGARASAQEAESSVAALEVDQAVQMAVANNRNLKIVSLDLDKSKEKLRRGKDQAPARFQHLYLCFAAAGAHQPSRWKPASSAPIRE